MKASLFKVKKATLFKVKLVVLITILSFITLLAKRSTQTRRLRTTSQKESRQRGYTMLISRFVIMMTTI